MLWYQKTTTDEVLRLKQNPKLQVLLWQYPDTERVPLALETHHQANIFGVKFLPCSGSSKVITGAMDYTVQLHTLDAPPHTKQTPIRSTRLRRQPDASSTSVAVHTTLYGCHKGRVKVLLYSWEVVDTSLPGHVHQAFPGWHGLEACAHLSAAQRIKRLQSMEETSSTEHGRGDAHLQLALGALLGRLDSMQTYCNKTMLHCPAPPGA